MKEPKRIPLDPSTPTIPSVKKIPMPALYPEKQYAEGMVDDVYTKEGGAAKSFWKFIAEHEKSREKWLNQQNDENNTKSD